LIRTIIYEFERFMKMFSQKTMGMMLNKKLWLPHLVFAGGKLNEKFLEETYGYDHLIWFWTRKKGSERS
jgi:hypothetical protein